MSSTISETGVEFTNRRLPLVKIQNVPGKYLGKVHATADTYALNFYFEYENAGGAWTASNACVLDHTLVSDTNSIVVEGVKRVTSTDGLEFFLQGTQTTDTLSANVSVTVLGTHEEGVIVVPDAVPDDATHVSYDDGYPMTSSPAELGRRQYYLDQMSSV